MVLAASIGEEGRPILAGFIEEVPNGAKAEVDADRFSRPSRWSDSMTTDRDGSDRPRPGCRGRNHARDCRQRYRPGLTGAGTATWRMSTTSSMRRSGLHPHEAYALRCSSSSSSCG
jgi:hypothetical protein